MRIRKNSEYAQFPLGDMEAFARNGLIETNYKELQQMKMFEKIKKN